MAVPQFFYFIRPALECLSDGQDRHWQDVTRSVVTRMALEPDDLEVRTKGGTRTIVTDRVQWALTYLRQAGLVEGTGRGCNRISQQGKDYLLHAPPIVRPADLMQFPSFVDFQNRHKEAESDRPNGRNAGAPRVRVVKGLYDEEQTPSEQMEEAYSQIKAGLAQQLLERVKAMSPAMFEKLVVDLMLRLGYGGSRLDAGKTLGKTGDGGVDGVINEDVLGLDKIYLQAKRWSGSVGAPQLREFVGSLVGKNAEKGVFLTTSTFTTDAQQYVRTTQRHIALIDGLQLAELMIDHGLGVACDRVYEIKRLDSDYFEELS